MHLHKHMPHTPFIAYRGQIQNSDQIQIKFNSRIDGVLGQQGQEKMAHLAEWS